VTATVMIVSALTLATIPFAVLLKDPLPGRAEYLNQWAGGASLLPVGGELGDDESEGSSKRRHHSKPAPRLDSTRLSGMGNGATASVFPLPKNKNAPRRHRRASATVNW
jgi:hypothetical protein